MPQFFLEDFAPQIVWLAISFALLYWLMSRVALPRIGDVLQARQERIASDLDKAQQFREQAEKAMAEYEAALQTARTESRRIHAEAQAELAAETDRRMNDLAERLQAESTQAAERIAAARDAALAEVRGVAVDLVQVAAERLIGTSIPADEARGAVERIAEGTR
jgi:F-type H+-transporting ATPase subunit b